MDVTTAAGICSALGQPIRIEILRLLVPLGDQGLPVGEIRDRVGLAPTTFGFHLNALVQAGAVLTRKEGRYVIATPNFAAIRDVIDFLMKNCCEGCCAPSSRRTGKGK